MPQKGLNGNQLKILALVTMTVDHIGYYIFPYSAILRIIGRLAMPLFAFMIAEGCRHTRSRRRYFLTVAGVAVICQLVYLLVMRSLYQCIMVTFAMSIALVSLLDWAQRKKKLLPWLLVALAVAAVYFITQILPELPHTRDFDVDYGFWGVMLPVLIYSGRNRWERLFMALFGLVLLALDSYWIQWYSLLALPLLAVYNGQRGRVNLKYLFYIYYPAHLVVLYAIGWLVHVA